MAGLTTGTRYQVMLATRGSLTGTLASFIASDSTGRGLWLTDATFSLGAGAAPDTPRDAFVPWSAVSYVVPAGD